MLALLALERRAIRATTSSSRRRRRSATSGRRRRASSTLCFRGSARDGLAERSRGRPVDAARQAALPDHRRRPRGARRLARDPGARRRRRFYLRLFVGGLTSPDVLDRARRAVQARDRGASRGAARRSSRRTRAPGNDCFHYFLLRLGHRARRAIARVGRLGPRRAQRRSGMRRALALPRPSSWSASRAPRAPRSRRLTPPSPPTYASSRPRWSGSIRISTTRSRARRFRGAVDDLVARLPELERDQILVELLRIVAMTGERDGTWASSRSSPTNARCTSRRSVSGCSRKESTCSRRPSDRSSSARGSSRSRGRPVDEVAALVRPLVTRDNESSLILRLPEFMITGEILHGLGISPERGHGAADGRARGRRASRCDTRDASPGPRTGI